MTAWKDLELRVCRALGGQRAGPVGAAVSDCIGVPWAVEVKRCKRGAILTAWLKQARAQGKLERRPWLLVVASHNDRHPTVTLELAEFVRIATDAGRIDPPVPDPLPGQLTIGDAA